MRKRFVLPILSAVLALVGCVLDDTGGGSSTGSGEGTGNGISGNWDTTIVYPVVKLTENLIVFSYPQRIRAYCGRTSTSTTGDGPEATWALYQDTSKASLDSLYYSFHGARLWMGGTDTSSPGPSEKGKTVSYVTYDRISGDGITGTWSRAFMDTVLALGIPETDSALQAMRAVDAKHDSTEKAVGAVTVIDISSGSITVHVKEGNWAMLELDDWNRFNAKHIALAPKIVDVHTIAFTAGDTVVTKTRLDRNRVQISCNAPAKYPTYIVYDQPTDVAQCSEGWFSAFVSAHYRLGGAARAASAPSLKPTRRWF